MEKNKGHDANKRSCGNDDDLGSSDTMSNSNDTSCDLLRSKRVRKNNKENISTTKTGSSEVCCLHYTV